jgi:undecaprenyl pyrophosphate phosphatase UppP
MAKKTTIHSFLWPVLPYLFFRISLHSQFVFLLAADWLQGAHVYVLYQSYNLTSRQIGELFVGGFASSMVFGTFIGSLADGW